MIEHLRERKKEKPAPTPTLTCFRCGLTRPLEDDGRRAHYAKLHVTSCPSAPTGPNEAHLHLVSTDHLEMHLDDGTVWLQIKRE